VLVLAEAIQPDHTLTLIFPLDPKATQNGCLLPEFFSSQPTSFGNLLVPLLVTKLNSVVLVRERTIPTQRPPRVGEVVPTSADRGCRVVSATDSHGR
jgi:hypothetical protein